MHPFWRTRLVSRVARPRAFLIIYMCVESPSSRRGLFLCQKSTIASNLQKSSKIRKIINRLFSALYKMASKKSEKKVKKNAKIFGQFKNLLYLCIRFRSKMEHFLTSPSKTVIFERLSIHNKM